MVEHLIANIGIPTFADHQAYEEAIGEDGVYDFHSLGPMFHILHHYIGYNPLTLNPRQARPSGGSTLLGKSSRSYTTFRSGSTSIILHGAHYDSMMTPHQFSTST